MLDFIINNLPIILCLVAGMGLIVLEVFLPGFGVPGISGIVLLLTAIGITLYNYGGVAALGMTIVIIAVLAVTVSVSLKSASHGALSRSPLVLKDTEDTDGKLLSAEDMQLFLGKTGKSQTVLRPVGIAEFDGVRLNVVTEGDYIQVDEAVHIVRVEGSRIVVRKA